MTQAEELYVRRVQNHIMRGQYDEVAKAALVATTSTGRAQFSTGFLRGVAKVLSDNRSRSTSGLLKLLAEHPPIAQMVMPITHDDPYLKGKLKLIFFAANHNAAALAQNSIKDLTPSIWDELIAEPALLYEFAYPIYQAVIDKNNMLEKFHKTIDTAQFLEVCKSVPGPSRKLMGGANPIAELINDRADFLDIDAVDLITQQLLPALNRTPQSPKWEKVHLGVSRTLQSLLKLSSAEDPSDARGISWEHFEFRR